MDNCYCLNGIITDNERVATRPEINRHWHLTGNNSEESTRSTVNVSQ